MAFLILSPAERRWVRVFDVVGQGVARVAHAVVIANHGGCHTVFLTGGSNVGGLM